MAGAEIKSSRSIRCFVALPLPQVFTAEIIRVQGRIGAFPEIRWIGQANLHLTTHFLGDVPENFPELITGVLDAAAAHQVPFKLKLAALGCFPNLENARVLWAGLEGEVPQLVLWQKTLETSLQSFDYQKENREFRPHITFGRTRRGLSAAAQKKIQTVLLSDIPHQIFDRAVLFQSRLTPQGPHYEVLHETAFCRSAAA